MFLVREVEALVYRVAPVVGVLEAHAVVCGDVCAVVRRAEGGAAGCVEGFGD